MVSVAEPSTASRRRLPLSDRSHGGFPLRPRVEAAFPSCLCGSGRRIARRAQVAQQGRSSRSRRDWGRRACGRCRYLSRCSRSCSSVSLLPISTSDGKDGGEPAPVYAVAHRALIAVDPRARTAARGIGDEAAEPGHLVGVDIQDAVDGIQRRAAPLGAAIKTGKHNGLLAPATNGRNWPSLRIVGKLFDRPVVHLRRAGGQHVCGQALAGKWFRHVGQRLRLCRHLSGHGAGRIGLFRDG